MQQVYDTPPAGKIALQYGLIFGLIAAIIKTGVLITDTFALTSSPNVGLSLTLNGIDFLLGLAAYFVAGILASKQTAKVSTGTFSGLWAGGVYGVIGIIVSLVLFFAVTLPTLSNSSLATSSANPDTFRTIALAGFVGATIFGLLLAIGLGAGLGALGGLIGKSTSKVATQQPLIPVYPPQPYPGQPYPGQPYPDQSNPYQPYPNQGPNPPYNQ